jgi:hypothetical protein
MSNNVCWLQRREIFRPAKEAKKFWQHPCNVSSDSAVFTQHRTQLLTRFDSWRCKPHSGCNNITVSWHSVLSNGGSGLLWAGWPLLFTRCSSFGRFMDNEFWAAESLSIMPTCRQICCHEPYQFLMMDEQAVVEAVRLMPFGDVSCI